MYIPLTSMPDNARVWVHQTDIFLSPTQIEQVLRSTAEFLKKWTAHQQELKASCGFAFHRHLVIALDESHAKASGCSIDSLTHFLQRLGEDMQVNFFNRMKYTFIVDDVPHMVAHTDLAQAYADKQLTEDTLFVKPLIQNLGEFRNDFTQALGESFLYRFVRTSISAS